MDEPTTHPCIVRADRDSFSYAEQYLVQCRCHMDSYQTWRPSDAALTCPVSGADLTAGITT